MKLIVYSFYLIFIILYTSGFNCNGRYSDGEDEYYEPDPTGNYEDEYYECSGALEEANSQISTLEDRVSELESQLEELQSQYDELEVDYDNLLADYNNCCY